MRRDDDLLSAYVDGIAELTPDERRHVDGLLAREPSLRADVEATREVLADLRAMPQPGAEPNWGALEKSIRAAVATERAPRHWLRWFVPAFTCIAAAAIALLILLPDGKRAEPIAHATPPPAPAPVQ